MSAGKRDKRVSIERATTTVNDYNEPVPTWSELTKRWTAIYFGKGSERRQAAMEQGSQTASFVMLSDSITRTITLEDRLNWGGSLWDIVSVLPVNRAEIEITATRLQ